MASISKPWLKYYSEDKLKDTMPICSMYEYLANCSKNRLDSVALNYYGTKYTYRQLFKYADEYALAFKAQGIEPGEMVSFVSVAIPETVFSIYALNKLGVTANLIDPRMDEKSILRMIKESKSRYVVCMDAVFKKVVKIQNKLKINKIFVQRITRSLPFSKRLFLKTKVKFKVNYNDNIIKWEKFLSNTNETNESTYVPNGHEVAAIAYTGGTTGFPKGVMFTSSNINAVAFNFEKCNVDYSTGQSFLGIIPVFTSYGFACGTHMPLCMGCELILIPQFKPSKFGQLIKQFKPNHMLSTPAFYEMMMDSKEVKNMDLSFIKTLGSGGDTMNEGLEKKFQDFMNAHNIKYPLAQGYGLSEMSSAVTFCVNKIYKNGSVGIPSITTVVGIFDPKTQKELPIGQIGEVCATGPNMMKGYFNRKEETKNIMRLHDDGTYWIHSGDLGYVDEDGFLFIVGRLKRMITRFDGHKVFPVNIESFVSEREDVHNCCVIACRDRKHSQGNYPLVLVELKNVESEMEKQRICKDIYKQCLDFLEERGQPVAVISLENIPLTGMGKNDYKKLEKDYSNFDYISWENKLW